MFLTNGSNFMEKAIAMNNELQDQIPRLFPNMYLLILVKGVDKSNSAVTLASPDGQITALDFFGVENVLGCQSSRNQPGLPVSAGLCE